MGYQKDLAARDAIEKIRIQILNGGVCLFATRLRHLPLDATPMRAVSVDEGGI